MRSDIIVLATKVIIFVHQRLAVIYRLLRNPLFGHVFHSIFILALFFFFLLPVIWCFVLVHLIDGKLMCLFMYSRYSNKIRFIVNVSLNYYLYTPSNIIACCTAICIFCCIIMIIVVHCSFMCDLMLFVLVSRLFWLFYMWREHARSLSHTQIVNDWSI